MSTVIQIEDDIFRVIMRDIASELYHLPTFVLFLVKWRRVSREALRQSNEVCEDYGRTMTEMLFYVRKRAQPFNFSCFLPWCPNEVYWVTLHGSSTYVSPICTKCLVIYVKGLTQISETEYNTDSDGVPNMTLGNTAMSTIRILCESFDHWTKASHKLPRHAFVLNEWSNILRTIHNVAIDQFSIP